MWRPPQPIAFNLLEAKRHRDRGAKQRRAIMAKLSTRPDGDSYGPENSRAAIARYRWQLTDHLLPYFARHRLSQITVAEVDHYRDGKVRALPPLCPAARLRRRSVPPQGRHLTPNGAAIPRRWNATT
jgi:hypothetical protein